LKEAYGITFSLLLTVVTFVSCSVMANASVYSLQHLAENKQLVFSDNVASLVNGKCFSRVKNREVLCGFVYFVVIEVFLGLAIYIPSFLLNTDQIIDQVTNTSVIFSFICFVAILVGSLVNRTTNKVAVEKTKYH
jgi:hypothetical protein